MKIFSLFLFLSLVSVSLQAQPVANFTANKTQGCNPLSNIQFTDLSTGGATTWLWIFEGNSQSILQNPSVTYTTPGIYDVTLIVGNGTTSDTVIKTDYIKVFANPVAGFAAEDSSGCILFAAAFQDLSVKGDTTIVSWSWDFGDGANSNQQNPSHTYNNIGNYTVVLQVTDANGCTGTKTKPAYIKTTAKPTANFSSSNSTVACIPPLTVNFTNSSTGSGTLSYLWYFGDNADTAITNPSHTYTSSGSFDVALVVTDQNGCKDSITKPGFVRIADVLAGFTMSDDTICPGKPLLLTDTSLGASSYQWTFAGGSPASSTAPNPIVSYVSAGNYTIQLIAYGPQQLCSDTVTDTVNVELAAAGFTVNPAYSCESPLTVNFTDTSNNAVLWTWNFGDGTPISNSQNPTHTYSFTGNLITYNVQLTIVSAQGCTTQVSKPAVTINIIKPDFTADSLKGCIPLAVQFTNLTNPTDSVATYQWNFGDGVSTPAGAGTATITAVLNTTGNFRNPKHTYIIDGDFTVTLITTTVSGCIDTVTKTAFIQAGFPQNTAFSVDNDTICADTIFTFTDETFDPALVDEWKWTIGAYDTAGNPNPAYPGTPFGSASTATYPPTDTGFFYVQLKTGYNGCYDSLLKDYYIYVLGPYINITKTLNCDSPFTYFLDTTVFKDVQRFYWDYDDGSPLDSIHIDSAHTYSSTGDYWVKLSTYNDSNNCKFIDSIQIFVREIIADFTVDTTIGCLPLTVNFDGSSSQDETSIYIWNYGDSAIYPPNSLDTVSGQPVSTHVFSKRGNMFIRLMVYDVNGCSDSITKDIKIYKPIADLSANATMGCVPFLVNFSDISQTDTPLVAWAWNFSLGENNASDNLQNTSYSYDTIGKKTVQLVVTDLLGCKDTVVKPDYIIPLQPIPNWIIADSTICFGTAANFTNSSAYPNGNTANLTYLWTFTSADSTQTSSQNNPSILFSDTGNYTVTLLVTDATLGCDSSITDTNNAHVQAIPQAIFSSNKDSLACYPEEVWFYDASVSDYIDSVIWNFGDGATSYFFDSVSHFYTYPGTFDVSLTVFTDYGCANTKTDSDKIIVTGPLGDFVLTPKQVCVGQSIQFWLKDTNNVTDFGWNFGDGIPMNGIDSVFHAYNEYPVGGEYYPTLVLYSSPLCSLVVKDTVSVFMVQAMFNTDTNICLFENSAFTDASLGADSWLWYFGDNDSATVKNTSHAYNTVGQYTASLIILNNATTCKDTVEKTITVNPLPAVTITPDTFICSGKSINLMAGGGIAYLWTPSAGLSATNISNPSASPTSSAIYYLTVTDANNCKNDSSVKVEVFYPPNVSTIDDANIIIGEEIVLYTTSQYVSTITWTPNDSLSCSNCAAPVASPMQTTSYIVMVKDDRECDTGYDTVTIFVLDTFTLNLPSAFTPNGDNTNDTIFARGWGLKELQIFQIYNRWGELLFETNNLNTGWDGTYKGEQQPSETYVFILNGKGHNGEIVFKKGYVALIR